MLHALLLAVVLPTYGPIPDRSPLPTPAPGSMRLPSAHGEALIVDSGSTNRAGYRLRVYADGTVTLQQGDMPVRKHVSVSLVKHLFADLRAAGPLDMLPATACMKSASFGSSMHIVYRGKMSPDVTCPGRSAAQRALALDAMTLANAAGASILPRPISSP